MERIKAKSLVQISFFSALIVLCSWLTVPAAVPFTMQTFGVFLASLLLGTKRGTMAVLVYILLGALGIPVFSGGGSGPGVLFGQNGGYILGFLIGAYTCGIICEHSKKSPSALIGSMLVGLTCVYVFGSLWYSIYIAEGGLLISLSACVLPFLVPDLLKIILAYYVADRIQKNTGFFKS